jgi:hypothetical protein
MLLLKICLALFFGLCSIKSLAHATIFGFEDTLTYSEKRRFNKFLVEHKQAGYSKCYYNQNEDTVICENKSGERVYFK